MINKNLLLRRTVTTLVSFVLCVCVAILTVCAIIGIACSEEYIRYVTEDSRYANLSYSALMTELEDITIPSGLPIDFFKDKIDSELFASRITDAFASNLKNTPPDFTLEDIKKEFYDISYEYALTQNRVISDEAIESLQGFADECATRYIRYANPSSVKFVLTNIRTVKKILNFGAAVTAALGIVAAVLLYFLCRKKDLQKHISFAFLGAGLLSGILPALLLFSEEVHKIAITAEALYSLTVSFIEGILALAVIFALVYLFAVIISFIIKAIVLKTKKTMSDT